MIKEFLKNLLLKPERKALEDQAEQVRQQFVEYAKGEQVARQKFMASFDGNSYALKMLAGFSPALIEKKNVYINPSTGAPLFDDDIYEAAKKSGINEETLLAEAASISKNEVFRFVIDFLTSRQMMLTALLAITDAQISFGRAHTTAYASCRGEFERLQAVHESRQGKPEDFDKHAAV